MARTPRQQQIQQQLVAQRIAQGATTTRVRAASDAAGLQTALDSKLDAEGVRDAIAAALVAGSNITITPNDGADTITISASGGSDPWTWTKLASNSTVSTVAFANVSGMSFSAEANTTYLVELFGAYQAAATTTGIGLALNVPAGATVIGQNIVSTNATALGGTEQIANATTTGATTGVRAANTNTPILARWIVAIGATPGTVQLMQRSEIAASNTILQAGITAMGRRII